MVAATRVGRLARLCRLHSSPKMDAKLVGARARFSVPPESARHAAGFSFAGGVANDVAQPISRVSSAPSLGAATSPAVQQTASEKNPGKWALAVGDE